ncbi:MAG: hypothetical protein K0Q66_728, partial [Chitinophagaceae bacterium]|nr:hypothetical protein [Chitinophagaceae bacterium]
MNEEQFKSRVRERWDNRDDKGRYWMGAIFLIVGGLLFARASGAAIPEWVFTWPMILITIGLFLGLRHGFKSP